MLASELIALLQHLQLKLTPNSFKKVLREISLVLKKQNQQRIRSNVVPDNSSMLPRQAGSGLMFKRIGRHIKSKTNSNKLEVGFFGGIGNIATQHHFGQAVHNNQFILPVRELVGISSTDHEAIHGILQKHLRELLRY